MVIQTLLLKKIQSKEGMDLLFVTSYFFLIYLQIYIPFSEKNSGAFHSPIEVPKSSQNIFFKIEYILKSIQHILAKYSKALCIFKKVVKSSQKHLKSTLYTCFFQSFQGFLMLFYILQTLILITKFYVYDKPKNHIKT